MGAGAEKVVRQKWRLFATQWFYSGVGGWLLYDLGPGHAQVVTRYTVTSSNDLTPRDPKDWQFQGSNDGSTWNTLDTQSNRPSPNATS